MARCKFCRKSIVWREVFVNDQLVWRTFDRKPRAANVPIFVIHTCREKEKAASDAAEARQKNIPDDPWWTR